MAAVPEKSWFAESCLPFLRHEFQSCGASEDIPELLGQTLLRRGIGHHKHSYLHSNPWSGTSWESIMTGDILQKKRDFQTPYQLVTVERLHYYAMSMSRARHTTRHHHYSLIERGSRFVSRTATAGSDIVQSGRPIFDDFFQHLWPYIGNNTANVVFQIVKRLWLIRIDQ
ncbi:hypothetical protein TNCV_1226301 [Trichonephila clavipes]|nr:hypothetical protein TNCV_1226301 [Trichonephila clavipes]